MTIDSVMTLSNIHMRFPFGEDWRGRPRGFVHALNGIDLEILRGKTLGVVGESVCGKSTLAQVLMGIRKPSEGEVTRNFGADLTCRLCSKTHKARSMRACRSGV